MASISDAFHLELSLLRIVAIDFIVVLVLVWSRRAERPLDMGKIPEPRFFARKNFNYFHGNLIMLGQAPAG